MSAGDRHAEVSAALVERGSYLAALASAHDELQNRFDVTLASVRAAHVAGASSDALANLQELSAALESIEWLANEAITGIDELIDSGREDDASEFATAAKFGKNGRIARGAGS